MVGDSTHSTGRFPKGELQRLVIFCLLQYTSQRATLRLVLNHTVLFGTNPQAFASEFFGSRVTILKRAAAVKILLASFLVPSRA